MQAAILIRVKPDASEDAQAHQRAAEAQAVWFHHTSGVLRSIRLHDGPGALLVVEVAGRAQAEQLAGDLPMVRAGLVGFEVLELKPFTGYEALFAPGPA